jgi:hypothetical protein
MIELTVHVSGGLLLDSFVRGPRPRLVAPGLDLDIEQEL